MQAQAPQPPAPQVITVPDKEIFGLVGARIFSEEAARSIQERGVFRVALAGGTSPVAMYRALADIPYRDEIDWSRIHVFFGDERCVPEGHADRNDRMAFETLLEHVSLDRERIYRVEASAPDGAEKYDQLVRQYFVAAKEPPRLDLIILGVGTDGHTASLFPGSPALAERSRAVVKVTGAPKPPAERITFTLTLINMARCVLVLAPGQEKRALIAQLMRGGVTWPIAYVRPSQGRLVFLVDPAEAPSPSAPAGGSSSTGAPPGGGNVPSDLDFDFSS